MHFANDFKIFEFVLKFLEYCSKSFDMEQIDLGGLRNLI